MTPIPDVDTELFGTDLFGKAAKPKPSGPVAARFTLPPFSILDARAGDWQERKRAWLSVGMASELGRKKSLTHAMPTSRYDGTNMAEEYYGAEAQRLNTSIFDPVLCELAYRWFSPEGGQVVDPFAGGSVRGIVAGMLGRRYWGCDLSAEQIAANETQADEIAPPVRPVWICGDSMDEVASAPPADFVFSCPPYGDLERYSDDPRDLSTLEWHTFAAAYKRIILRSVLRMKSDRFACFVVGNFRDGRGFYRDLVGETVRGFEDCGARFYNDGVLATAIGNGSMRVARIFGAGRKFIKVHQNVLVFCKGDWRKATEACVGQERLL